MADSDDKGKKSIAYKKRHQAAVAERSKATRPAGSPTPAPGPGQRGESASKSKPYTNEYGKAKKGESASAKADRQKKFYTKQREDAERKSDAGDADASDTAAKIYGKLAKSKGEKPSIPGLFGQEGGPNADKAVDQANKGASNRLGPLRNVARAAGTALDQVPNAAGLVTEFEGMRGAGGLVKGAVKGTGSLLGKAAENTKSIFSKWGSGAARSGEEAAAKTAAKTSTRASGRGVPKVKGEVPSEPAKSSKPTEDAASYERVAPKVANAKASTKPKPAPKPSAAPAPAPKQDEVIDKNAPFRTVNRDAVRRARASRARSTDKPASKPKPAPKPSAAPVEGEHPAITRFKNAPKGSPERKAAWNDAPPEAKKAYQAGRGGKPAAAPKGKGGRPKKGDSSKPAAPKYTDAAHEAYETGDMNKISSKADLETYKARYTREVTRPDGSKARETIPKGEGASKPAPEAAPSPAAAPAPKGGHVREKIRATKRAKEAAAKNPPNEGDGDVHLPPL